MHFISSKSNIYVPDEPIYKNELGSNNYYSLYQHFDLGVSPSGWSQVTNAGGVTSYTRPSEAGTTGLAVVNAIAGLGSRSAIIHAPNVAMFRSFTDAKYTILSYYARSLSVPQTPNAGFAFGWINRVNLNDLQFDNTLCFFCDPSNISGYNAGLIPNICLLARADYNGAPAFTLIDLGIAPSDVYKLYQIIYDNVRNQVRVYVDNILIYTLTNLANVPAGSVRGVAPSATSNIHLAFACMSSTLAVPATNTALITDLITVQKSY